MTDPTSDPRDELASAHLDGATSPEEAALVAADPAVLARVEELRSVRAAIAQADGPVDEARRELALAAALAVFDEAEGAAADQDAVLSLGLARARRARRMRVRLVGAAAAIALGAAFALPRLSPDDGGDPTLASEEDGDTASRTLEGADPFAATDMEAAPDSDAAGSEATADAPVTTIQLDLLTVDDASDLGAAPDLPTLVATARDALDGTAVVPPATPPVDRRPTDACLAALQSDAGHAVMYVAVAELDGRPVVAVVVAEPEGGRHLVVAAVDGCERLASEPL